jgi:hypothetical protein
VAEHPRAVARLPTASSSTARKPDEVLDAAHPSHLACDRSREANLERGGHQAAQIDHPMEGLHIK